MDTDETHHHDCHPRSLTNYAIHLTVTYDSDMRSDYGDLRFKHESSGDVYLNYWIENMSATAASVWVKIPSLATGNSRCTCSTEIPARKAKAISIACSPIGKNNGQMMSRSPTIRTMRAHGIPMWPSATANSWFLGGRTSILPTVHLGFQTRNPGINV